MSRTPRVAPAIEAAILRVSRFASWVWLLLIFVIVTSVTLRYVFGAGRIELEELQWHRARQAPGVLGKTGTHPVRQAGSHGNEAQFHT